MKGFFKRRRGKEEYLFIFVSNIVPKGLQTVLFNPPKMWCRYYPHGADEETGSQRFNESHSKQSTAWIPFKVKFLLRQAACSYCLLTCFAENYWGKSLCDSRLIFNWNLLSPPPLKISYFSHPYNITAFIIYSYLTGHTFHYSLKC